MTILPETISAGPRRRRGSSPSPRLLAVVAAVAVVAAGAVVYLVTRGPGAPASSNAAAAAAAVTAGPQTAAQWLSTAFAAANAQGAAHVEVVNNLHGRRGTYSDDDGARSGVQRITVSPGMRAEVRVLPGVTYFAANRAALKNYFGFPASVADRAAGRWLVLHPGDPGYATVTEAVTFRSMMKEMTIRGPLRLLPARTLHGVRVVGIRGVASGPATKGHPKATAILWVAASGSHLPVLYQASSRGMGSTTTTFSRWGMQVSVAAPTASPGPGVRA
jgi:hypothetical protein